MNLSKWQHRLFYLILFLIPANLAKHFPVPSSYISGILVDYLIPTLYLTDILIILLLLSSYLQGLSLKITLKVKQLHLFNKGRTFVKSAKSGFFIFLVLLLPAVIFSSSPIPATFKWLKFLELSLFALWIKNNINPKKDLEKIINVLSASVLFQSLLALAQWFKQSSVAGFWFLGEQPYTSATPGIDKITWFTGAIKIPPLGTFPHPNVLAGFLAITLPLILYKIVHEGYEPSCRKLSLPHTTRFVTFMLGAITLFLTFSLFAWLGFLMIGLPLTLLTTTKIRPIKLILIYSGLFLILFSFATKLSFLAPASSFSRRSQLTKIAIKMFKDHPLTGVGLNNFTVKMEQYGHVTATTRFLQPVHNIYLLILTETGLIGLLGFLYLLIKGPFLRSRKAGPYWIAFSTLLFIGLFDHYPITIHQTTLLFFLTLSLL